MNSNQILRADILDIIFEKRNKKYGAYALRKYYPNRLKLALGLMFIIAIIFSGFTLVPDNAGSGANIITNPMFPDLELREVIIPPLETKKKMTTVQPVFKELAKPIQKVINSNVLIVDSKTRTEIINTLLPTDIIGAEKINNVNTGHALVEPAHNQNSNTGTGKAIPVIDSNTPMDGSAVDVLPSFPGGLDALRKFLEKHLQNPYDLENGETISVKVRFVVDYHGKLQSFVTVQDGGEEYSKEVMRVLKKMPDWIPGKSKGENVSVYYIIPVRFIMSN